MSEQISNTGITQAASKMLAKTREEQDKPKDAVKLLKADHDEAQDLYKQFFDADSPSEKQQLATELALALSVHMRIEEDIFYPAVTQALQRTDKSKDKDQLIIPEAKLEHESLKKLIAEVESGSPDADFEAHLQVMCEYTKHHIKEEESKMFSRAKDCDLDLDALGSQLASAKLELLEQMAESTDASHMPSGLFRDSSARRLDTFQTR
jgi:hypothetical protein